MRTSTLQIQRSYLSLVRRACLLTLLLSGLTGMLAMAQEPQRRPAPAQRPAAPRPAAPRPAQHTRPVQRPHVQPARPTQPSKPAVQPSRPNPPSGRPTVTRPPGNSRPPGGRPPGNGHNPGNGRPPGNGHNPGNGRPPGGGNSGGRPPGNHRPPISHRPPGWKPSRPAYTRPPHVWNGRQFYTYHRYYSHPYRPYVYGPAWHPLGFFLGAIAASATIIAIDNMNYRYDAGVFYEPADGGYKVVAPPMSAVVPSVPEGAVQVQVGDDQYYYYGGVFYLQSDNGYMTVHAPAGAIVYNLPDGATSVNANGVTYLQYNNDYYQPIQDSNGQAAYEVVDIEDQTN